MMKCMPERLACWLVGICLLCAAAFPIAAADGSVALEAALQHYIALPDALLPVLEAAKDKESAEAAAADLQALLPRVYEVRRELMEIPELAPETAAAVRKKYEMQMRTRWGKVYEHIFRLQRVRCYEALAYFKHFNTLCMLLQK